MKHGIIKALTIGAFAMGTICCSPLQKAMKEGDVEFIYSTALDYYNQEKWSKASPLFETVAPYYLGTEREDTIAFYSARSKFKDGDFYSAIEELDAYRRKFGRSPFLEDSEGMYTMSHYYLSPEPARDQTMTQLAITSIDEFISRYPESENLDNFKAMRAELTQKLYDKDFINAYTYYKIGKHKSAIVAFRNAIKRYPLSTHREELSYYVVASSFELADNSIPSKQEERFLATLDSYYTFIAEFPESEFRKDVDKIAKSSRRYLEKRGTKEIDSTTK